MDRVKTAYKLSYLANQGYQVEICILLPTNGDGFLSPDFVYPSLLICGYELNSCWGNRVEYSSNALSQFLLDSVVADDPNYRYGVDQLAIVVDYQLARHLALATLDYYRVVLDQVKQANIRWAQHNEIVPLAS